MRITIIILSMLLMQPFGVNATLLFGQQEFMVPVQSYVYQYIERELDSVIENSSIELNRIYSVGDNHTLRLIRNEAGNLVLEEYLNQQLWTTMEQDAENLIINSYQNGIISKRETYNQKQLIAENLYSQDGVIEKTNQYTGYSTIEIEYTDGQAVSLIETNDVGVIREGEYTDGKLNKETFYTSTGIVSAIQTYDQDGHIAKRETYDLSGVVTSRSEYRRGVITKTTNYYSGSTKKESVTSYEQGVKASTKHFNQDGVLTNKFSYFTSGEERGLVELNESYNQAGIKTKENRFDRNGQVNRRKLYSETGVIENYFNYQDNKLVSEYLFDKSGLKTDFKSYYPDKSVHTHVYYEDGVRNKREVYNQSGVREKVNIYKVDGSTFAKTTTYYTSGAEKGKTKAVDTYYPDLDVIKKSEQYDTKQKLKSIRTNYSSGKKQSITEYKDGKIEKKTFYNEKGKKAKVEYYEQGEISRAVSYNKNSSYKLDFYLDQNLIRTDYYNKEGARYKVVSHVKTEKLKGYKTKKVSTCDMTTTRAKNVVVDIGVDTNYANRDYYAYTNKYGQLVRVDAAQIITQNETYEDLVWGRSGLGKEERYCESEAQVTGSEPAKYDRGHVIADSLGGAANAYNITPEVEEINVAGGQAKMEQMIRMAFIEKETVTDFSMKISYKNKTTNIPDKYTVSFKIDGNEHNYTQKNE